MWKQCYITHFQYIHVQVYFTIVLVGGIGSQLVKDAMAAIAVYSRSHPTHPTHEFT